MSTTIIAMYDNADKAQQVLNEIVRSGVSPDAVEVLLGGGNGGSSLVGNLTQRGVEKHEAAIYAEVIGKGAAMVAVDSSDEGMDDTYAIMNRFGAQDLDQVVADAKESSQELDSLSTIEEQVSIGKRRVLRGGMRLTSTLSERPIEETIRLREEKVAVERHQTDRKLSPEEAEKAFQQQTIEVMETAEEAVISKEARVVEEVTLGKTTAEREETVHATARRTEVNVEEIDPRQTQQRKQ